MQLPKKQKYFSELFGPLLKSALNFEHFEKKDEAHSWYISKITDFQIRS